jgi:hypothetical protein
MAKKRRKGNTRITEEQKAIARAKAAKKGWKTRRKNKLVEKVQYTKKKADYAAAKLKLPKLSKLSVTESLKDKTIRELKAENAELKFTASLVPDAYWTKRDGTAALHPSMVRALVEEMPEGARQELEDDFDNWVDDDYSDAKLHDLIGYWADWFHDEYPEYDIPLEDFYAYFKS